MTTINNTINPDTNDEADVHKDEIGENSGDDTLLAKEEKLKNEDDPNKQESSNKGQGPKGEDL